MTAFGFGRRPAAGPSPLRPDERRFVLGTRSLADLIAPGAVEVARDHLRLDYQYARTLVVTGYPRAVSPGWLTPLLDFAEPLEIAIHVHPLESPEIISTLTHKLVQLTSSRLLDERSGRLADPEREVAYEDAERLRDSLQRGEERVFSVSLYVLVRASSPTALDDVTHRVETTLSGLLAHSRVALFEQDRAFRSCLPTAQDELRVFRNLDTSSLATTFPFSSSSLAMARGLLFGVALHNHSPVLVNPFDPGLENANLVLFAKSGAGKSYFTKLLCLRALFFGIDFIVIDPENEYESLAAAVGGQRVRLAAGDTDRLNPFDLPPPTAGASEGLATTGEPDDAKGALAGQVATILGLLEQMVAEPGRALSVHERAVLDRAIYRTYARRGITSDQRTHDRPPPILGELHDVLRAEADGSGDSLAGSLALRLDRYVGGSLAGLFAGPTNVSLDARFVVFDTHALAPELRPLGTHLIASFVWTQIRRELRPRLLVIDEAWGLLRYPEGGAFLADLARRARKHYLGVVTITQDVADFLGDEAGRTVLTNSTLKLLMKQDSATVEPVTRAFGLSTEERRFLLGAEKGEGLLFTGGTRLALRVEASPAEHELATTAPWELATQARRSPGTTPRERGTDPGGRTNTGPEPDRSPMTT